MPDIQGRGETYLQGVWKQDAITDELLNYTEHQVRFTCDSFYIDFETHSKVNYYPDSCFNNGIWKEYAKGTYRVDQDTLKLYGVFTKSNYKQKISGCYQIGQYIRSFRILSRSDSAVTLQSTADPRVIPLILDEKLICQPQAL